MTQRTVPQSAVRRSLLGIAIAGILTLGVASGVAAAEPSLPLAPEDLGVDGHSGYADRVTAARPEAAAVPTPGPLPAPQPTVAPSPTTAPSPTPAPEPIGIDISYPQCGGAFPDAPGFAIVGVNGGRVFSENRCLGTDNGPSQLAWAGREAQLYVNTGNPGPRDSRHWPVGQEEPRLCDPADIDSLDCAYDYGWNAAHYAYEVALAAWLDVGWADADATTLPSGTTWWLDVEDANSWRADSARNIAALQGMVDALAGLDVEEVGFYSTPRLWARIVGATDLFEGHPAWHAGAADEADAADRCAEEQAFTGGELRMVQWVEDGIDRNLRCDD